MAKKTDAAAAYPNLLNVDKTALINLWGDIVRTFDTPAAMVASTELVVGETIQVLDGRNWKIVAAGTGTADGINYIDLFEHQAEKISPADDALLKSGGTMTGKLLMPGLSNAAIGIDENGHTINLGSYNDGFLNVRQDGIDVARFEDAGTAAAAANTVMTREKGDARYGLKGWDYESAETTLTASSTTTFTHGLGVKPAHIGYTLVNQITEWGYGVGAELRGGPQSFGDGADGIDTHIPNTTGVIMLVGASILIKDKNTRVQRTLTMANWKIIAKASL